MTSKVITIVGLGLLGGSYAMGLKKAGNTVYGIDIKEESVSYAKEKNYISDGATENFEKFLKKSDIIILCIYPQALISWIEKYAQFINSQAIITDVCGVKSKLVNKVQESLEPYGIEFYASHPMRGKEVLGIENADCAIFKDANLILTPTEKNSKLAEEFIIDMAKTLGFAVFSYLTPHEHDSMIAYLSQLTHAIAVSLMTAHDSEDLVKYSGDSFRDLTRIAKIDENLWSELFLWNKELLCDEIDIFIKNLQNMKRLIENNDVENLKDVFRLSTKRRELFNKKGVK